MSLKLLQNTTLFKCKALKTGLMVSSPTFHQNCTSFHFSSLFSSLAFFIFPVILSCLLLQVAVLLLVSVDAPCWDAVLIAPPSSPTPPLEQYLAKFSLFQSLQDPNCRTCLVHPLSLSLSLSLSASPSIRLIQPFYSKIYSALYLFQCLWWHLNWILFKQWPENDDLTQFCLALWKFSSQCWNLVFVLLSVLVLLFTRLVCAATFFFLFLCC